MVIVFIGLSITSSWGNGHATTYRGLVRALAARRHQVWFLEQDQPWYASNRDLAQLPWGQAAIYSNFADLDRRFGRLIADSDVVIVGSYVPDGVLIGHWVADIAHGVVAFYDIDTPVTLEQLSGSGGTYLSRDLIPRYDLYLSFTGGPILELLEQEYGARTARALYCSSDVEAYYPEPAEPAWDMGYLGTYSADRQPALERLLVAPARAWRDGRFAVAGPQYPDNLSWPSNVDRICHLPPGEHRRFYNRQRFTLNVTRATMVRSGWAPSIRLFEAAASGTAIVSDRWPGLETFFEPGQEILIAEDTEQALAILTGLSETRRQAIGLAARRKVLSAHTAAHRADELENHVRAAMAAGRGRRRSA